MTAQQKEASIKPVSWISRNPVLVAELVELRARFGEKCVVFEHKQTFTNAKQIVGWVHEDNAKHAVIVAPLSVISHVLKEGPEITWLYGEMSPLHQDCPGRGCKMFDPARDVLITQRGVSRHHRFAGFKKIVEVRIVLEDLSFFDIL